MSVTKVSKATRRGNKTGAKTGAKMVGAKVKANVKAKQSTVVVDGEVWSKSDWMNCILPIDTSVKQYLLEHTYVMDYLNEIWDILSMSDSEPLTMINRHTWLAWGGQHVRMGIVRVNQRNEYELLIFDNDNHTTTEPVYRLPLDSWNCDDDWKRTSELGLEQGYSWLTKHEY